MADWTRRDEQIGLSIGLLKFAARMVSNLRDRKAKGLPPNGAELGFLVYLSLQAFPDLSEANETIAELAALRICYRGASAIAAACGQRGEGYPAMTRRAPRSIPPHRKDAVSFSNESKARARMLKEPFCGWCKKLLHRTKADAHSYIGLLVRTAPRKVFQYTLRPYRCPHRTAGWHVGRDIETVRLFKEAKKK